MGIEIRKRVARREIDVVIHSGDFVPGHQLAWCPHVRGNCCRSREGGRLRRRRQREYTLHRRRFAAPRGPAGRRALSRRAAGRDRKSTRLNSSHGYISYAVFCLKKKKK